MAPTAFKDIGKLCSDLLSKDYKTGSNSVEVKSKVPNGITFTPKADKTGDKFSGSLAAKSAVPGGADLEVTLKTSGVMSASLEAANMMKGLSLTLDCETPAPGKPGLLSSGKGTLDYKTDALTAKGSYDYYRGDAHAAASSAFKALTFGACADYSVSKSSLSKYAAACQYVAPDFTVCAKLNEALGKPGGMVYAGSYYHKVSPKMQVGTEVSKAAKKDAVSLAFGCQYKLDKDLTVKGKVDADGMLSASYKHKLSNISTLTLATVIDTVHLAESSKHKFGLALNLTP
nr:putative outer mitochondrial membrane protein porin [Emiliania huxleyi]